MFEDCRFSYLSCLFSLLSLSFLLVSLNNGTMDTFLPFRVQDLDPVGENTQPFTCHLGAAQIFLFF